MRSSKVESSSSKTTFYWVTHQKKKGKKEKEATISCSRHIFKHIRLQKNNQDKASTKYLSKSKKSKKEIKIFCSSHFVKRICLFKKKNSHKGEEKGNQHILHGLLSPSAPPPFSHLPPSPLPTPKPFPLSIHSLSLLPSALTPQALSASQPLHTTLPFQLSPIARAPPSFLSKSCFSLLSPPLCLSLLLHFFCRLLTSYLPPSFSLCVSSTFT